MLPRRHGSLPRYDAGMPCGLQLCLIEVKDPETDEWNSMGLLTKDSRAQQGAEG